jgi:hypothetical protein
MGLGSVLTGLAIYKPVQFGLLTGMFGGYGNARVIHFILTLGYCLFFLVHVVQVIIAGWNNFQAMVTGFEVVRGPAASGPGIGDTAVGAQVTEGAGGSQGAGGIDAQGADGGGSPQVAGGPGSPQGAGGVDAQMADGGGSPQVAGGPGSPQMAEGEGALQGQGRGVEPWNRDRAVNRLGRRSFLRFSVFTVLGVAAWKSWFLLKDAAHRNGVQGPLRRGLFLDEKIFSPTLSPDHLAPTYPTSAAASNVRRNGNIGLSNNGFDAAAWCLNVTKANGEVLEIPLSELQALPKTDPVFEFKCIEGWSQISWWGGVRFSDLVEHYQLQKEVALNYVGLATPDDQYYVGIDTPSAMHPQTLLCYEMNGKPLAVAHGAPLRLIIPIKYGVKSLKRVGKVFFGNERPRDYWFERGYDYYCGL